MPPKQSTRNTPNPNKRNQRLRVLALATEKQLIEKKAQDCGMSVSRYLRELGLQHHISGVVDCQQVQILAGINGDLGRLGGLLKLWLTNDERTKLVSRETLFAILHRIDERQQQMATVMEQVLNPVRPT